MLFPISGVDVNPAIPFFVALGVSFFTAMGGISGAFLLLPFQVSILGYTAPSVSATNQVFNIVAIPSGVYRYIREGRMLWPLTWAVIAGTLPGVFIGAWIRIRYLPDPKNFKLFVGLVLGYIGLRLVKETLGRKRPGGSQAGTAPSRVRILEASISRVRFQFAGGSHQFSPSLIFAICFLVGILGGIYGIGGGAIVAPFLVAIVGLPVYTVAGAALMGTFITSVAGVVFYQCLAIVHPGINVAPDWMLGSLFGLGGFLGMYLGARMQKFVPEKLIKGMICSAVLFVSASYIMGYF